VFRNPEFKAITRKLFLLQLVFSIIMMIFISYYVIEINNNIIKQNTALVGKIMSIDPSLGKELVPIITKEATSSEIQEGKKLLEGYGYTGNLKIAYQPLLKELFSNMKILTFSLVLLFFIPIFIITKGEYNSLYSKVKELSLAADKVIEGDFSYEFKDGGEGDFNILSHQFNQMANRLENSLESLKKEKIFLQNIISDISHQLKTPLSSLIMFNELILEDENMDENTKIDFLERSQIQLKRMEWLIINLLKAARIESGAIQFEEEKVYLYEPVDIAISSLDMKIKEKNIKIEVLGEKENSYFYGDKEWTGEALINIIKNCIEHSDTNGSIEIILEETPVFSRIIVKDYGEGIDRKDLPHIFKRFYKGKSEVKVESIGIGLNLAKLIVESQGGIISVESKKGMETQFTITFLNILDIGTKGRI